VDKATICVPASCGDSGFLVAQGSQRDGESQKPGDSKQKDSHWCVSGIGRSILISVACSIRRVQAAARLCVEYSTISQAPARGSDDLTVLGIGGGIRATSGPCWTAFVGQIAFSPVKIGAKEHG
jgi:hypothetical protein